MKKPKVFANPISKKINNNQIVYEVDEDIKMVKENNKEIKERSVNDKIDELMKRNGYIFNVDVKIVTKKCEYNTKIAGKINNHLITLDNDIINIDDIIDLEIKE